MADDGERGRRSLLRGAAVVAGAAAVAPLPGEAATAQADGGDADALFKAGRFEQAGRAYEEILKKGPTNLWAARRRGHVGLVANRFPEAEKYLTMALKLAPDDRETNKLLGDCYIRQDELSLSVPCWQAAGAEVYAEWFAAVSGRPYQVHGDIARLPWQQMDPEPLVEASVNGGPPKRFTFYTGEPWLGMSAEVAKEAGPCRCGWPVSTWCTAGATSPAPARGWCPSPTPATRRRSASAPPSPRRSVTQPYGFDVPAHFSHCFYKPYNVTLDFADMNLYIARGKAG